MISEPSLYHEEQHFRQWWLWTLVVAMAALGWWSFIQQVIFGRPFGDNPAPNWGVWLLWLAIGLGLPFVFGRLKLVLEVTRREVVVRFSPLSTRAIPFTEIGGLEVRDYNAILEYGGWGVKGWSRKKIAYNISGNRGVELSLRDGRRIMLGSQRPEELAEAIQTQRRILDRHGG